MSDEIEAIRARWAGVAWHYTENVAAAQLYADNDPDGTITLAPVKRQRITLRLAAYAPADIAALLARIDELLNESWGDSLTIIAAAQRYRASVRAGGSDVRIAKAALFAALDAVEAP